MLPKYHKSSRQIDGSAAKILQHPNLKTQGLQRWPQRPQVFFLHLKTSDHLQTQETRCGELSGQSAALIDQFTCKLLCIRVPLRCLEVNVNQLGAEHCDNKEPADPVALQVEDPLL